MNREDYIQTSVSTRVYEKGLLDLTTINRLIDASSLEDFQRILSETSYSDVVKDLETRSEFDHALDVKLADMYKEYYKITKDPEVVEILASKYIFHNLKTVLKSYILKEDLTHLIIPITDYDYRGLYEDLLENNIATKEWKFKDSINKALAEYEDSNDPQRLDMTMDTDQNEYMIKLAEHLDSPLITEHIRNFIDVQNVNMTLRGKRQNHRINCVADFIIRGGNIPPDFYYQYYFKDTEELVEELKKFDIYNSLKLGLDKTLKDNRLLHIREATVNFLDKLAIKGKNITYGPEVLFSFMLRKEREVQLVRTIVIGKINELSPEDIRERTGELIA